MCLGADENVVGRDWVDEREPLISSVVVEDIANIDTCDKPIVSNVFELNDNEGS